MPETTIRNPTARWATWLVLAIVVGLVTLAGANNSGSECAGAAGEACQSGDGLVIVLCGVPFIVGLLLAAYLSYRARLTLTDEGVRVHALLSNQTYPWRSIREIRMVKEKQYVGGIRNGTGRRVELLVDDGWVELPVPRAGLLFGREQYEDRAELLWETWRRHVSAPR
jgi:PH (Pleckstrin Homology) domain-containing protein